MANATDKTAQQEAAAADLEVEEQQDGSVVVIDPDAPADSQAANQGAEEEDEDSGAAGEPQSTEDAAPGEQRTELQERRHRERVERRRKAKEREERLRRDLAQKDAALIELRQRLDQVERRTTGADIAQLDNAIAGAQRELAYFQSAQANAVTAGNGAAVADATMKMMAAKEKLTQLSGVRKTVTAPQPQQQALPNPLVMAKAQAWTEKNNWYDPKGSDLDSRITLMIDQDLAKEGFAPQTQEYWDELDKRVSKHLPHRASQRGANGDTLDSDTRKPRSVVPGGGGREAGSTSGGAFTLSADRVRALKDAGLWDDPKARSDMIRRYRDQDKGAARQR